MMNSDTIQSVSMGRQILSQYFLHPTQTFSMGNQPPEKTYFVELYNHERQLKNKFKLILQANTIKQLKRQILEKLINKKEVEKNVNFALKDNDDYELNSDDEVLNVILDDKVKMYVKDENPIGPPAPLPPPAPPSYQPISTPQPSISMEVKNPVLKSPSSQPIISNKILEVKAAKEPNPQFSQIIQVKVDSFQLQPSLQVQQEVVQVVENIAPSSSSPAIIENPMKIKVTHPKDTIHSSQTLIPEKVQQTISENNSPVLEQTYKLSQKSEVCDNNTQVAFQTIKQEEIASPSPTTKPKKPKYFSYNAPLLFLPPEGKHVNSSSILNLSKLTIPIVPPGTKMKMLLRCPQIRKTVIELPFDDSIDSYLDLSKYIVGNLNLDTGLKAIPYNKKGQPFFYNLDLMLVSLFKLDLSEQIYVIFTASPSTIDEYVIQPEKFETDLCALTIELGTKQYCIQIDLDNTLSVLKYEIFKITRIPPNNQILKSSTKEEKGLINSEQSLRELQINPGSTIKLSFKLHSNYVPCNFPDTFFYKDIKHIRPQSQHSINQLRSNLLTLTAHLTADDKLKLPYFIRGLTQNMPLTYAVKCLMSDTFTSQCHRIALEEGFMLVLSEHIKSCTPKLEKLEYGEIFTYFRNFMDFAIEAMKKITNMEEIKERQQAVEVQMSCPLTYRPIKSPILLKLDNKKILLVDKGILADEGQSFPDIKSLNKNNLFSTKDLEQFYIQFQLKQIDNPNTKALYWIGFKDQHPSLTLPTIGSIDKYKGKLNGQKKMKVHQPLEIKNKTQSYLLLKTKEGKLRVFIGKNKDIAKPYDIYNVFTGEQQSVNLDLMSANVSSENVEEVIDKKNFKPIITRNPKEAIAVLFDISKSMGQTFFKEPDLKRIGAVKSFFEAFAYRTIAYNFQHVVSLFFFDNVVDNQCGFTEAIYDFNRLVSTAAPRNSTFVYDAIITASKSLKEFKKKYPDCILRILALTDGQDTGSTSSMEQTAKFVANSQIIVDSFAVGTSCNGLKIISKTSGGNCYLAKNLGDSLKLFEQQTVLSVRARKQNLGFFKTAVEVRMAKAKYEPFDLPNNVHEFNMPKSKEGALSTSEALIKIEESQESKKISGSASLKRIVKEIKNYSDNPHPFIAIFPCANINLWKILLLGPRETPYENGLFILYALFPGDYPLKAPEVRFVTPIYHCNVNSQGRICHSVFSRNYSPNFTFRQLIDCVYGLVLTPEPQDPLDNVIASFYLSDYQKYYKRAIHQTKEKAKYSIQQVVDSLFGKIVNDGQRKQKEVEIEEWLNSAQSFN